MGVILDFKTIGAKTFLAGGIFFCLSVVSGSVGLWTANSYSNGVASSAVSSALMRDIMTADMMHDGLRADALNAYWRLILRLNWRSLMKLRPISTNM